MRSSEGPAGLGYDAGASMRRRPFAALLLPLPVAAVACQFLWSYDDLKDEPAATSNDAAPPSTAASSSSGSGGSSSSSSSSSGDSGCVAVGDAGDAGGPC